MSEHILPGDPPIALLLRRSAQARRLSLRVSGLDGRVTLTLPRHVSEREALDFAHEKADWLRGHLSRQPTEVTVTHNSEIPFEGGMIRIVPGNGRAVKLDGHTLAVPGDPARVAARVQAFLKQAARDRLAHASDRHATTLGYSYGRLTLRDTRSRWGSCTSDGGLMYSWRLIMAPPAVLDYVAAHEVAHLAEMNHSPAFWAHVERLFGNTTAPRRWLRADGPGLHRYRF